MLISLPVMGREIFFYLLTSFNRISLVTPQKGVNFASWMRTNHTSPTNEYEEESLPSV